MARERDNVNIMTFTVWLVLNNETHVLQYLLYMESFSFIRVQQMIQICSTWIFYCMQNTVEEIIIHTERRKLCF